MKQKILNYILKNGVAEKNKIAIYQYGLSLIFKKAIHIFVILLLGLICGEFACTLLFLITYANLRQYSGGYHAKTKYGCMLCTVIVTCCAEVMFRIFKSEFSIGIWITFFVCGVVIWVLSPQESLNHSLEPEENKAYRKLAHRREIIFALICILGIWWYDIFVSIVVAWVIQTIMLLICNLNKVSAKKGSV